VFGHEHYAEDLEDLACAGVPIQHPISGKTVGAVDLTCWRSDAGPLLMTLAKTTAGQIRQALLADAAAQEIELLQEYLRVCRRTPGIVIALNNEVVMMNDYARTVLAPADQAALLQQATEALAGRRRSVLVDLPTGTRLRMYARSLGETLPAGGVIHAKVAQLSTPKRRDGGTAAKMLLPGLLGSGALWRRACDEVENAFRAGEWVALAGEPGVGKLAILRAVHQRRNPGGRFTVLDAADATDRRWLASARRALVDEHAAGDERAGSVIIRHPDQLDGLYLRSLTAALQEPTSVHGKRAVWVAVTLGPGAHGRDLAQLLRLFPSTVDVPPLRHHIEDVQQLAPFFVARLGYQGQLTFSPEVLQMLMRSNWPGNVEQVFQTLRQVVRRRRTGVIQPQDLPPEFGALSRRLLSPLESIERDAITQSLLDAHGNKAKAAKALGMSRATIYRKIHEFGIVTSAE
jgi:transcriptional regulator of acetoin/glycerol metabolism